MSRADVIQWLPQVAHYTVSRLRVGRVHSTYPEPGYAIPVSTTSAKYPPAPAPTTGPHHLSAPTAPREVQQRHTMLYSVGGYRGFGAKHGRATTYGSSTRVPAGDRGTAPVALAGKVTCVPHGFSAFRTGSNGCQMVRLGGGVWHRRRWRRGRVVCRACA